MEVAPLGVDRLHPATGVGLVDDVVVIQRAEMHQFAGDPAAHHVVAGIRSADLGGRDGDDRAKPFAARHDEVGGDLGEVRVGRLHGAVDLLLDPFEILVHRRQGQERRHLRGGGHAATLPRSLPAPSGRRGQDADATLGHEHSTDPPGSPLVAVAGGPRSDSSSLAVQTLPLPRRFLTGTSSWSTTPAC